MHCLDSVVADTVYPSQQILYKMYRALTLLAVIVIAMASTRPTPVKIPEVTAVYQNNWYSGYLDVVFQKYTAHMHYFYFPSQGKMPGEDPLLFWFNGGPGCSSLLGALYQHGPFIYNDAFGFLVNNPQAWNMRANTVYIESPAQVGFSYLDLPQNQSYPTWNDKMTASLNFLAVLQFFNTFPEFFGRPTYLAGQSYGGIYVPTLAFTIHQHNKKGGYQINLKGFAVGNGCTDPSQCQFPNDYPHYLYTLLNDNGILNDQLFAKAENLCNTTQLTDQCNKVMEIIDDIIGGINIYDVYRPCWQTQSMNKKYSFRDLRHMAFRKHKQILTWSPPCVDSEGIDRLLKNRDNRKILGIPEYVPQYSMCTPEDVFKYDRSKTGSLGVYQELVPLNKYKIVIYSGDSDPAVPISGTLAWMNKIRKQLGLSTQVYWKPWMTKTTNGVQNSGALWRLSKNLSLFRFKGVGHMAPQWNSQGGTKLINYFLFNEQV